MQGGVEQWGLNGSILLHLEVTQFSMEGQRKPSLHKVLGNYYFVKLYLLIPKDRTGTSRTEEAILFQNKKKCLLTKIAQVEMKLVSFSLVFKKIWVKKCQRFYWIF